MARLLVNYGTPQAWEIQLRPGVNSLGRDVTNDCPIDHESVAGAHCQILLENDSAMVHDLGSATGTFIDLVPVRESPLRSGQTLRLGEIEMLFDGDTPDDVLPPISPPFLLPEEPLPGDPPVPPPVPATRAAFCKNHRSTVARLQCTKCQTPYCDICVSVRTGPDGAGRGFCLRCGGECLRLAISPVQLQPEEPDFLPALPGAFAYPFQGDGWILLVAGTVCYALFGGLTHMRGFGMFALSGSLILMLFVSGYILAYMMRIITSTAEGAKEVPDWPDFGSWEDILGPWSQGIGTIILSFFPAFIAAKLADDGSEWLVWLAYGLGCLYLPMAFLAVSIFDRLEALNPLLVVPSIARVFKEYAVACALLIATFALSTFMGRAARHIPVPFLPRLVGSFISFYFLIVEMRILGLLYLTRKDELGWFNRKR